eukprot:scaffold3324_cov371-Prasinococcus_capsulatus_cf.AAC.9
MKEQKRARVEQPCHNGGEDKKAGVHGEAAERQEDKDVQHGGEEAEEARQGEHGPDILAHEVAVALEHRLHSVAHRQRVLEEGGDHAAHHEEEQHCHPVVAVEQLLTRGAPEHGVDHQHLHKERRGHGDSHRPPDNVQLATQQDPQLARLTQWRAAQRHLYDYGPLPRRFPGPRRVALPVVLLLLVVEDAEQLGEQWGVDQVKRDVHQRWRGEVGHRLPDDPLQVHRSIGLQLLGGEVQKHAHVHQVYLVVRQGLFNHVLAPRQRVVVDH